MVGKGVDDREHILLMPRTRRRRAIAEQTTVMVTVSVDSIKYKVKLRLFVY